MKFYWLTLGILAVWRLTYFLHAEDGPLDLGVRLRRAAGSGFWGKLLDCFYCLSIWIAVPFAWWLGETWRERFLLWLSFSAGASLLQKLTAPSAPPAWYAEEPGGEENYGMLRTAKSGSSEADGPGAAAPAHAGDEADLPARPGAADGSGSAGR